VPITFGFVDQSSPNIFHTIGDEMYLIKYFSDFRYVDPFRSYLRSKSKVVTNRTEFWTAVAVQNFAKNAKKIPELWSTNQKVIGAHVDPPNWTFSGDYISASRGAGPSNFYTPY